MQYREEERDRRITQLKKGILELAVMRTGPICRSVQDAAKILDVIAGYDPKDEMTVFSIGRAPAQPYSTFATTQRLEGVRIGVIREYMNKKLSAKADEESIDIVERAINDLRKIGATIVDPGPDGALFQGCIARYGPELLNAGFTRQYRELFPTNSAGQPDSDQIAALLEMHASRYDRTLPWVQHLSAQARR